MKRHVKWVEENLPNLALRGDKEVQSVVSRAKKSLGGEHFMISIVTGLLPVPGALVLARRIFGESATIVQEASTVGVVAVLGGYVGRFWYEHLMHNEIKSLADDT